MTTKLGYYCDKILEWGWLAALVFTPLFFNVYSSRVFEPDKLSMLRSIVAVMAVAWGIKLLEGLGVGRTVNATTRGSAGTATVASGWPAAKWWRIPLLVPIALYAALFLITSIASVTPEASIFGSYQRLQGLISQYAYIMLALILIFNVRTRAQVERIISFAIATAAPVALYGLMQHQGLDPLPWAGDVQTRVASSMGNAIFVAAWLIMVVPLMLYRIVTLLDRLLNKKSSDLEPDFRDGDGLMVLAYAVVFLLQNFVLWVSLDLIAANQRPDFMLWFILPIGILIFYLMTFIYGTARKTSRWFAWAQLISLALLVILTIVIIFFTESRGPEIGLLVGLLVFSLSILWAKRWWIGFWIWAGINMAGAAFLVVFNLPDSPIANLRNMPYIGRLGLISQLDEGTGKVRTLIWQGAINLIKSDPLRMVIGYGPESMYVAYNKYYPADLQHWELRNATPDRSHNAYIDQMVTMGILGELAWLFLIGAFLFFVIKALRRTDSFASKALILSLAGGVISHLVEIAVGIQIAATYTYFYTFLGVFVAFTFFIEKTLQPQLVIETDAGDETRPRYAEQVKEKEKEESGVLAGVSRMLKPRTTLALAGATSEGSAITMAFASSNGSNRGNGAQGGGNQRKGSGNRNKANQPTNRPASVPPARAANPSNGASTPATNGSSANGIAADGSSVNGSQTKANPPTPVTAAPKSQIQRANNARQRVASGRVDQSRLRPLTRWISNPAFVWIYVVMAVVALIFIVAVNVSLVYADMLYKQGQSADSQQIWPSSVQYYQQAINWQPDQDYYYLFMGRAYMEWSKNPGRFQQLTADQATQARDQLIQQSETTLLKAKALNPMNTDHYANLGRLYIYWGGVLVGSDPKNQAALDKMKTGVDYYLKAVELSPQNAQIWNELALAQRTWGLTINQTNPVTPTASTTPTSTETLSSTGSVTSSGSVTSTGTVSATNTTTTTTTPANPNAPTALNQPMPVRDAGINPDALVQLHNAEDSINHTINVVDNKFANSYFIKGEIERSLGDAAEAAKAYISMITLVPVGNDTPSLASLADNEITQRSDFLVAGRVYTDVITALKDVTTKSATPDPNHQEQGLYAGSKDAHNALGFLYWRSGQLPLALTELQKVETIDGNDYFAHRNLAVLFGLNNQPQQQLNELFKGRDILNNQNLWQNYFSSQQDHDTELASVNATITQVEQANPGLQIPASTTPQGTTPAQP